MNILVKLPSYSLWVLIRTYQLFVSPLQAGNCRYHPTCSQFALEAVERHGPIKGTWLGIKRIVRCHPWGSSGFDPVPPQQDAYEQNRSGKCIAPKHARGYIRASNSTADPEL